MSAIVLAGGRSLRMGQDKAGLRIGRETLLERTIRVVAGVADEVLVAGGWEGHTLPAPARAILDAMPNAGPIGGILAGLRSMRHEQAVVVACDHPFLDPAVLRYLAELVPGHDAVVPVVGGHPQPTHAVYASAVSGTVEACVAHGEYSLRKLLSHLQVRWVDEAELRTVDPELRSLINVNTPGEWEGALLQRRLSDGHD